MRKNPFTDQRGTVWALTCILLVVLMAAVGLAIDTMHAVAVRNELQKAMDAAALAGAGNLGFSGSVFPTVRQASQTYAGLNPYSDGTITLNLNTANAANGNIVLGNYKADGSFTPTLDATYVNAVQCRVSRPMPTSFLGLLGWTSLTISADAIGITSPPGSIPPDGCLFPMGVTQCPFVGPGGNYGTAGCGQPFATQSPTASNTSAWIDITGSSPDPSGTSTPSANQTLAAVNAIAAGCNGSTLRVGEYTGANNGQQAVVYQGNGQTPGLGSCNSSGGACSGIFVNKFNASSTLTLKDKDDNPTYEGKGWVVYVPVLNTPCPPGSFSGPMQILTFGRVIITQVIESGYCTVANHYSGNLWDSMCPAPNGSSPTRDSNLRAVFGYYDCAKWDALPAPPGPMAALGNRIRLVK